MNNLGVNFFRIFVSVNFDFFHLSNIVILYFRTFIAGYVRLGKKEFRGSAVRTFKIGINFFGFPFS